MKSNLSSLWWSMCVVDEISSQVYQIQSFFPLPFRQLFIRGSGNYSRSQKRQSVCIKSHFLEIEFWGLVCYTHVLRITNILILLLHPPLDKVRKKSSEFQEKTHEVDFASSPFHNMKRSIDWYPSNELFFIRSWTLNSSSIAKKPKLLYRGVGVVSCHNNFLRQKPKKVLKTRGMSLDSKAVTDDFWL